MARLLEIQQAAGRHGSIAGVVEGLISLMVTHDYSTGRHVQQVGNLLGRLTIALGLSAEEAHTIVIAGWLHDIGKLFIPDFILKKPAALTAEEWVIMRTHAHIGAEIVASFPALHSLAPLIRAHHERWDGHGYPDRLTAEEIPLGARVIAVVDAYIAMTEDRPYQKARSQTAALAELRRCSGQQFDPLVVDALTCLLEPARVTLELVAA